MATKKAKDSNTLLKVALVGATAAAIAGGYFFYGKEGAKHRKKLKAWSIKAKGEVMEKLEKAKTLSEQVFHEAVDMVSAKYAKVKGVTPEDIELFAKDLKKHWRDIKKEIM
jgi:histone H3/H4